MKQDKPLVIGMAGLGTVGSGVARLLEDNAESIAKRAGRPVKLKSVVVRSMDKERVGAAKDAEYTTDLLAPANDPEVDVVLELIGGTTAARDLIVAALENGKHVVTANKALLAEHGDEIFPLARRKNLHLGFEASVAGGIPILQPIRDTLAANELFSVMGILNGTANFILTQMSRQCMPFDEALAQAQEKGYAEADPTLDIEGIDAAHKLVLLVQLAFGLNYPLEKLRIWGISRVTPMDIAFARQMGYEIKLLGTARKVDGKVTAGVYPALVPSHFLLAKVEGSYNAVRLEGNAGPVMLYGYGAGDLPTASAVLADVIAIARNCEPNNLGFPGMEFPTDADILDLDEAVSEHFLRFIVPDRPGVLRDIAGVLASHDISIAQVIQKGEDTGAGVPLVLQTHEASAREIHTAMDEVEKLDITLDRTMHYRIL
ncbi:homoserine dehydrogenase [Oceanidesulfovibrio indonesiensis]|uniref:Homoserine dehydrogenase n=1 Tax=Oceanidesulfovibrio indonesiensis TaxID=54767 RepID=A0A7M3MCQ8_9BACT|nr:homoserine dehydrogenase [Oceanidesulfovibrio indonesiensis]TVM16244.1 homoserine dehydrogenase [Oceanidesulfovibrio indonesiensis]